MKFNKKNVYNLLFVVLLVLFFIPNTRGLMQIGLTRLFAWSPSVVEEEDRQQMQSYEWKLHGVNTESKNFNTTKGKVVLVNFWATWCPPCIAEMPSLQALYDTYKDSVEFIFLTTDDDPELFKFMNAKHYTFPVYRSLSDHPAPFKVSSIPATYLIDTKGNIVIYKVGAADWDASSVHETLDALLE